MHSNTALKPEVSLKDDSKKIAQFVLISVFSGLALAAYYFYIGFYYLTAQVIGFCVTISLVLLLKKRGLIKNEKPLNTLIVNLFLVIMVFLQGLKAGGYLYFFAFFVSIPYIVDTTKPYKKEMIFYFLITSISYAVCFLFADERSTRENITDSQYTLLYAINSISALIMTAGFSHRGIQFNLKYQETILEQKNTAEALSKELCGKSKALQAQSKELQVQTENLQSVNEELHANTGKLEVLNRQLAEERENSDRANRAKTVFLATMSHEIRTPMNGVIGMASLLSETKLDTEQEDYVKTIQTSGNALLAVINDILDFSKIESGNMEIEHLDFDLRKCVEDVMDLFAGKAAEQGLDLVYQIDHMVPTQIVGDSIRLRQVIINVVSNALKFTHKGEVFVKVHLAKAVKNNIELAFEIKDSGIGIPENKLPRLFKAFTQVDSSTTRKYGGTGLGLAISERLVKLMGGVIEVESEIGVGTTFTFTIQVKIGEQSSRQYAHFNTAVNEGKKVLVIDDNFTNLDILRIQLEQWKLVPALASSGKQALEILEAEPGFNLVITDMQMPDMDGMETARAIKAKQKQLPIILLSSVGDETRSKYPQLFNAVLTKPVKQAHLFNLVQQELKEGSAAEIKQDEQKKPSLLSEDFASAYPLNILLAEDNLINQKLAVRVLTKLGFSPEVANNGREAVDMLAKKSYDLILMDVLMPEMDGLEATGYIRKNSTHQPIIVAMTANALPEDREECIKAGMNDYISKPINLEILVRVLQETAERV